MEAYGRKCPEQFINNLTPMEFDEMVVMFNKYDVSNWEDAYSSFLSIRIIFISLVLHSFTI